VNFTSWVFFRFFVVVLIGLRLMPTRTARQGLLLVASAVFYAYWNPWYLILLATPSVIDYVCAIRIEDSDDERVRRRWLIASIVTNLGLLAYFKYANFFLETIGALTSHRVPHLDILLPVGISFYTFKTLSYTIDVYRRQLPACRRQWQYAMFVTYFPELVAGPIVRASVFLPQLGRSLEPSWPRAVSGAQLALVGVTKKIFVADRLAGFVDAIFATPSAFAPQTVTAAVIAYSIQIYCDFSGYTDIAIGISRIIGYDLPENFNMPYAATSIIDFWRRWHMTLSSWLRDYLYIPLGGNRKGRARTYINLLITMLLGGLWHGASWTFVLWGLLHGVGLAVNRAWREATGAQRMAGWLGAAAGWAMTYAFVTIAWVFFRAPTLTVSVDVLRKLFWIDQGGVVSPYLPLSLIVALVVGAHLAGIAMQKKGKTDVDLPLHRFAGAFALTVWLVGLFLFSSIETKPFIYFRF
jgi:alginate O-acetyltransferase complex protein AlgI